MRNIFILIAGIATSLFFGQNRKGEYQLHPTSSSHTLYVAFKKAGNFNEQTASRAIAGNTALQNLVRENALSFEGLAYSETKLTEMANRSKASKKSDEAVQKLKRIYKVSTLNTSNAHLLQLAKELESFPEVDYVSLMSNEPIEPPYFVEERAAPTPNLEFMQNYFYGNPGISADYAWSKGISGQGITVRDVEYGFSKNHEALSDQSFIKLEPGYQPNSSLVYPTGSNYTWLDHGTAVASILSAKRDNVGVGGSAPDAVSLTGYLEWTTLGYDRVNAVNRAIQASSAGDIIMYEMQTGGRNANYVPAEYDNLIWDLTKAATDSGITIIAAAGNGSENLDDPFYNSYNGRGHSGAIIVGAGNNATAHSILSFSTYGSRVDIQGWGTGVLAAGYGTYAKYDNDYNRTYAYFSGTSSATPVVTSAFALAQAYYKQKTGTMMGTQELLTILKNTGYPQGGDTTKHIGPFPNVQAAMQAIDTQLAVSASAPKGFHLEIAPNPAAQAVRIRTGLKADMTVEVWSATGQKVKQGRTQDGELSLDISQLPRGTYLIKAGNGEQNAVEKLIKK